MIGFSRCLNVNHDLEKDCGRQLHNSLFKASAPDKSARGGAEFPEKSWSQNVYAAPGQPSIIERVDKDGPCKIPGNTTCICPSQNYSVWLMNYEEKQTNLYQPSYITLEVCTLRTVKFSDGD